ncbi:hypothetical protein GCM10009841_01490 [Microlunatus panaciterrae]|uniref:Lipopolysaccharide assembly protein A domain-containing protein n=1 Tax=Microlunatus panaciterrae TaxID=400768 RepID=A0ABS2RM25_9ACTN|nr:hypothetical protein [Microlunatus panaciterrae]MBM7799231.1 hypothetical protein [Microlunatus panaciterrae]
MIPIAIVLLLIVIVFTIAVVVSNPGVQNLSIFGANIPVNDAGLYLTGAGAMLVLVLALALLRTGLRRANTKRKEIRALVAAASANPRPAAERTATAGRPSMQPASTESASTESASTPPRSTTPETTAKSSPPQQPESSSLDLESTTAERPDAAPSSRQADEPTER